MDLRIKKRDNIITMETNYKAINLTEYHPPKPNKIAFERDYFEKKFQTWLWNHLFVIEKGLTPYSLQVPIKIDTKKRIYPDILAVDKKGKDVIIEIKYWANLKTIDQLNKYIKLFPSLKSRRGIIVAKRFTKDFKLTNKDIKAFQIL